MRKYNFMYAKVQLNNKYGFINSDGIVVIPCIYTYEEADTQLKIYKLNLLRKSKLEKIL